MDTGGVEATDLTGAHTRVPGGTPTYEEDKRSVDCGGKKDEIRNIGGKHEDHGVNGRAKRILTIRFDTFGSYSDWIVRPSLLAMS